MIRTQISLSEAEYQAAKREAAQLGISLAELLRRSLRTLIPSDECWTPAWSRLDPAHAPTRSCIPANGQAFIASRRPPAAG